MGELIGIRLRQLRKKLGYTQEFVGKNIGVSKQTLYKYEMGIITNIPSDKIEALAKLYGVQPEYIMGWDSSTPKPSPSYYVDPETAELADRLKNQPGMRMLFDAAKDASPEDLEMVAAMIRKFKK